MGRASFDFQTKHVLISGASRGIGRAIARAFLQAGANITILGLEDNMGEIGRSLALEGSGSVQALTCDITKSDDIQRVADAVQNLNVLINNAGLEYITPIRDPSPEVDAMFRKIIEINVIGTFSLTRALLPCLQVGGCILNTASVWAKTAVADFSAYCSSKHAVLGLTRSWARELAPQQIRVNAVCPGWVRTDASMRSLKHMSEKAKRNEEDLLTEITDAQALGGLMEPTDVADLYLFLASDMAASITGQAYSVDRGECMQ